MSIERAYYCDGPDCGQEQPGDDRMPTFARTASGPPYLPHGIIEVRETGDNDDQVHHFCGWGCLTKFAAKQPLPEIIRPDES